MKKWMVGLLLIIFLAPGILAYLFYSHPTWLSAKSINRGQLIRPAFLGENIFKLNNKWRIVLWQPNVCDTTCMLRMEQLARVRLALGRRLYNVDVCLMQSQNQPRLSHENMQVFKQHDLCYVHIESDKIITITHNNPEIFLVNPDNYWVLRYEDSVSLDDLYHDIKHLLVQND